MNEAMFTPITADVPTETLYKWAGIIDQHFTYGDDDVARQERREKKQRVKAILAELNRRRK
jgi:hypothetical protein